LNKSQNELNYLLKTEVRSNFQISFSRTKDEARTFDFFNMFGLGLNPNNGLCNGKHIDEFIPGEVAVIIHRFSINGA
jgi:hypothetical protein